ncbi:MAG: TrbI/VirB10 family protein [Verrucomicrobiae bacterium]|nr:TrbI/VirB10 family protein [Verrucomicrobiae bacterium]
MNGREIINFFTKTKTGPIVAFLIVGAIIIILAFGFRKPREASQDKLTRATSTSSSSSDADSIKTVKREVAPPLYLGGEKSKEEILLEQQAKVSAVKTNQEAIPLTLYNAGQSQGPGGRPVEVTETYAPYGRLIPCELVITVDSSNIKTPIIGMVTEDLWHNGRLVIPAGAEVHGTAQADKTRERIASSGSWVIVWRTANEMNGMEMRLQGIALDMEKDYNSGTGEWALTDGSAGLRGELLRNDNLAEVKLFVATFLGEAADVLEERSFSRPNTFTGEQTAIVENTPRNAALAGVKAVTEKYVEQIMDAIERDGFYVRVPAGKQFYLYVTQTIDREFAKRGNMLNP